MATSKTKNTLLEVPTMNENTNTAYNNNYNNAVNDNVVSWPKGKVKKAKSFASAHKVELAAGGGLLVGLIGGTVIGSKYSMKKWSKKAKKAAEAAADFVEELTEEAAEA